MALLLDHFSIDPKKMLGVGGKPKKPEEELEGQYTECSSHKPDEIDWHESKL